MSCRESEIFLAGQMITLASRGLSLFVREEGTGFPLLIMHGGPGADHSTLLSLLPLADRFRLIFYDHRCNGRSTGPDLSTMSWSNLTADAEGIRQHLGMDKWALLGHSFGGMVALEYAIRYPNHITQLVLLDTGGDASWVQTNASLELQRRGFRNSVVSTAAKFYRGHITRHEFIKSMFVLGSAYYSHPSVALLIREALHGLRIRANPDACIYGFNRLLSGWSVMTQLKEIKAHTLVIAGIDDFQFPPEHQKELSAGIVGSKLVMIPGAGHNAHIEKSEEVVEIIGNVLKEENA